MVGGPRADADARDAGRARARGAGARAARRTGASRATLRARRATRYSGTWFDPAFARGRRRRAPRRPDLRRGARAARSWRAVDGPARRRRARRASRRASRRRRSSTSPACSARRTAASAGRRAARSRRRSAATSATSCSPIRAPTRAACRTTTARRCDEVLAAFADAGARDEGFADSRPPPRGCSRAASRTRRASSTTPASPTTSRSSRPARCRASRSRGDDKRLFDLVVRRFLGAFHPPAHVGARRALTDGRRASSFRTRARTLMEPGWRAVLADTERRGGRGAAARRSCAGAERGERRRRARARGVELRPRRPSRRARITEARLLSLMENAGQQIDDEDLAAVLHEKGIGTPATRADIIENLIAKGYVVRARQGAAPDRQGHPPDRHAAPHPHRPPRPRPQLTGEIEQHLLEVERGGRTPRDFMGEIARLHARDRRARQELRVRRALRRERDVSATARTAAGP